METKKETLGKMISFISFNIVLQFLKISVDTIRKSEAIGKMSISKG